MQTGIKQNNGRTRIMHKLQFVALLMNVKLVLHQARF